MKKIAIISLTLGFVVSLFGQGQINFSTKSGSAFSTAAPGAVFAPVFLPDPAGSAFVQKVGAAPYATAFYPAGTTPTAFRTDGNYTGAGVWATGTGFTAQLWSGAANSTQDSDMTNLVATATMRTQTTSSLGGTVNYSGAPTVAGVPGGSQAAFQLRVWDNQGGTITSWADVLKASNNSVLRGASPVFTAFALQVAPVTPPNLQGLQSFSLYQVIPEPSVVALGVLGIGALVLFRRRKN